jgi:hypothetical protein
MRINKFFFLILSFIFIVLQLGCSKNVTSGGYDVKNSEVLNGSLRSLLQSSVDQEFGKNINNVEITDFHQTEEDLIFITFMYLKDVKQHIGIMYAGEDNGKYELGFIDGVEIDLKTPISIYNIASETSTEKIKRKLHIVIGSINNSDIHRIDVSYPNGEVSALVLSNDQKTYTEINVGSEYYPDSIKAISDDNKILYQKKY